MYWEVGADPTFKNLSLSSWKTLWPHLQNPGSLLKQSWSPDIIKDIILVQFSSVQSLVSSVQSLSRVPLCDPMNHSTPGLAVHHQLSLLKFRSIESVMPSTHLILCHPLLLLPSIFPSIRVFSNESVLHITWQSIGASASVPPMNIQDWFPLWLTGLIFLQSKGLSRSLL